MAKYTYMLLLLLVFNLVLVMGAPFCKMDEEGKMKRGSCYCNRVTDNRAEYR